jgi:chemotaxis protein MotB
MKRITLLLILAFAVMGTQSCVSSKKFNELMAEKEALAQSVADLQNKIKMMEEERRKLAEERDGLTSQLQGAKSDLDKARADLDMARKEAEKAGNARDAVRSALRYWEKSGLKFEIRDDRMYLTDAQPILFRTGSVRLSKEGRDFVGKLAETLKANPDLIMMVEGHADSRPISTSRFSDNWDLSAIRATSVVRELVKNGVNPSQLTAAGRGEHAAMGDDKAQHRRAEFIVLPRLSQLAEMAK